jgi:predicted permease
MQDFRYALRGFRKQPVFSVVAVLTLALGIGATTAVFSVLYQVLIKPLPYRDADRLVSVGNVYLKAGGEPSSVSIPDYLDRRGGAPAIADATLFTPRVSALDAGGVPEQIIALAVTPSFFTTLGRGAALGRSFGDADVAGGTAAKVAILTDATWRTRFGGDPSIVGRAIRVNGEPLTVVGVLPRDFEIPWRDTALLLPFAFRPDQVSDDERGNEFSWMIARLRPGATVAQLDAQMDAIVAGLMTRVPSRASYMEASGFTGRALPLQAMQTQSVRTQLYIVQAAVVLVLLIACANVGNLLLMRAAGRQRELAIRTAIGAGRRRIVRQMVVEGLLLASIGGALGIALSVAGVRGLVALSAEQLPMAVSTSPDPAVLLFAVFITGVTGVVFGVVPAAALLRGPANSLLKDDTTRGTAGRRGGAVRRTLVIVESAVAVVLVVGAGLLVKSFAHVTHMDAGFNPERVLTAQIALRPLRYPDADARRAFWQRLSTKVAQLPGVTAAGLVGSTPFSGEFNAGSFMVVGRPVGPGEQTPHANQDRVGGDYFAAMQIPLRGGRFFSESDAADAPRVAIVDDLLARQTFPRGDAIGHQLNFGSERNYTIVGIVGTVKAADLAAPAGEGRIYLSAVQVPPSRMGLVIKASASPESLVPAIREAVRSIDPEQPIAQVREMGEWIERSLQPRRTPTILLSLFGATALALAALGMYGVLAFGVSQRLREFGIRQALGARGASILALVLREGLATAGIGLAIGVVAALILTRGMRSLLVDVPPADPVILAGSALTLLAAAAAAAWLPARRATEADPMTILRSE